MKYIRIIEVLYIAHKWFAGSPCCHPLFSNFHWFIWLCWVLAVVCEVFNCNLWDPLPWSGIEPRSPALAVWSPSHWATREALLFLGRWPGWIIPLFPKGRKSVRNIHTWGSASILTLPGIFILGGDCWPTGKWLGHLGVLERPDFSRGIRKGASTCGLSQAGSQAWGSIIHTLLHQEGEPSTAPPTLI